MSNRRNSFRIELFDLPLTLYFSTPFGQETWTGKIYDLSGNGVGFYLEQSIPPQSENFRISFTLLQVLFEFELLLIRQRKDSPIEYYYGATFVNFSEKQRAKLSALLLKLDGVRRFKGYDN